MLADVVWRPTTSTCSSLATLRPDQRARDVPEMGLEGIVSKRKDSAYRSGPTRDWLKIKTASRRAANEDRWELFEKKR